MGKKRKIAVVGKGGTGKTTISGFMVKYYLSNKTDGILAIDADPSINLGYTLGILPGETIGDIREETLSDLSLIPPGMTKQDYLTLKVNQLIQETDRFDLLTMGRPEGPGCYCAVNNMLRNTIDTLVTNYERVIIDCEPGMEHLSRRSKNAVDDLIVVTDTSIKGTATANEIVTLMNKLKTPAERRFIIFNRVPRKEYQEIVSLLKKKVHMDEFQGFGIVPEDETISRFDRESRPLLEIPVDAPSYDAFVGFMKQMDERISKAP
jgi:CO dehydrogenase maturation factor